MIEPVDPGTGTRILLRAAMSGPEVETARALFLEYQASLGIDLEFQAFSQEVAALPGGYAPPDGVLLLAILDGDVAGCVGVRRFDGTRCEMKRLYVRPAARRSGAGRLLAARAMACGRELGYACMLLDTLPSMTRAQALYAALGFRDVPAYRDNPIAGTRYMEARL